MLHALKTEFVYFRLWLLGGLGIATFVAVLLSLLVRFLEEGDGPPSFVIAMFPIIAGMVVAFVAQGYRIEERRARMLMAGPLTPRQLAGVTVFLPVCFVGLSVLTVAPMIGLATLITGKFEPSAIPIVAGFAGQFWAYAQLGPLAQESSAARRQRRSPVQRSPVGRYSSERSWCWRHPSSSCTRSGDFSGWRWRPSRRWQSPRHCTKAELISRGKRHTAE
jgi:hypothetical protein